MKESAALAQARAAARRGETDDAVSALRSLAAEGDVSACPSLAELLALKAAWDEVIQNAAQLIANPSAAYAGNVFDDMVRLLGRAGRETGRWADVERCAREAAANVKRTIEAAHLLNRYVTILDRLATYAKGRGSIPFFKRLADRSQGRDVPDHELIMLWKKPDELPLAERKKRVDNATANVFELRPDLKDKPQDLHRHLFALAEFYDLPREALERYSAHPEDMWFKDAVYIGRFLAAQDKGDEAWKLIQPKLPIWIADDPAQVAPIALVVDRDLQRMMTPDRCAEVLRTPRSDAVS
jgi:hypothetical protein